MPFECTIATLYKWGFPMLCEAMSVVDHYMHNLKGARLRYCTLLKKQNDYETNDKKMHKETLDILLSSLQVREQLIREIDPGEILSASDYLADNNSEVEGICIKRRAIYYELLMPLEVELKRFEQLHQDKMHYWKQEFKCILRGEARIH
jgi:hypothetical protein